MAKYKKRKDGRYCTHVELGKTEDGKRNRVTLYANTITELDLLKADALLNANKGTLSKQKNLLFKDYKDIWYAGKKVALEHATILMYDNALNHCEPLYNLPIFSITKSDIQEIFNSTTDKPRTCQKIKITLNQIFESAIDDEIIYKNPCKNLTLPKYTKKDKRVLTANEDKLSDLADFSPREACYVRLIKYYGLRKEEALALTKEDFNFKINTISINKAIVFISNQPVIKDTKSKAGNRNLRMLSKDIEFFRNYLNSLDTIYLFTSIQSGKLLSSISYRRMFEAITNKMNNKADELNEKHTEEHPEDKQLPYTHVEGLTAHIFRHNYCTTLYHAGIKIKEAAYLMGHSSTKVTMEIYTHLDHTLTLDETTNKLEAYHNR